MAQQRVADDDHHVADGRGGGGGAGHGIPRVKEIIRCEILDQITDKALNQERGDDGNRYMLGGILCLASHRGYRLKADQNENGDRCLNEHEADVVRRNDRCGGGVGQEGARSGILLGIVDDEGNLFACRVEQRQGCLGCRIADDGTVLGRGVLVIIGCQCLSVVLEGRCSRRMASAISDGQYAEDKQRGDLNHVDGQVDGRGSTRALRCNPADKDRKENGYQRHEERAGI